MDNSGRSRQNICASLACVFLASIPVAAQAGPTKLYSHGDPTDYEQYLLEMVNRARIHPVDEAASYNIDLNEGLPADTLNSDPRQPLALNPLLIASARQHSQWMLDQDVFSHTGINGSSPMDRMQTAGYSFIPPWASGENIAWVGSTGSMDITGAIPQIHENLFVDGDVPDRGHRINLLNDDYREIGIGAIEGPFIQDGVTYNSVMAVQDFGTSAANPGPFLVGVVYQDSDSDGFYTPGEGWSGVTVTPSQGDSYAITSTSGGYAIPLSGTSRTLTVTISQGPLAASITKTVVLTGKNVKLDFETIKDTPATSGVKLGLPKLGSDGRWLIPVFGTAGQTVQLQTTSDLKNWQANQTVTLTGAETDIFDTPPASSARFYRLIGQ